MSATETVVFTLQEADEIAAMRKTLDAISERLTRSTYGAEPSLDFYYLGLTVESLKRAEDGLFLALNVASAYMHDEAAKQAIDAANAEQVPQ